jgi:hypothetical protein
MDTLVNMFMGLCLSAACGFRIFVPFLLMSIAAQSGFLSLAPEFEWIATTPALVVFATATVVEILAYYIPWFDNLLDIVTTPAAVVAGILASASVIVDLPPLWKWTMAIIAGGGVAGLMQGSSTVLRGTSTLVTGGLGNFLVASGEIIGSVITSILAILVPVLGIIVVAALCFLIGHLMLRNRHQKRHPA